ncbi:MULTISPECIES: FadR/GntR family transcriptional regulator [unclassified Mycolicibacterium]|uniref:FadR/GntR family transcriptional regulator n=1 Tax=unclassified Mycolicibacterium TaxID=2636767 RepID=UPI0012DF4A01|nr:MULTISPECIES: FadR/GntR family transcriptional regulator [unclassified Mycolicibacterium]MUL84617.1 FadR family transcriptional regulator [Mycolicibacterium sp. CBMA 329]MUL88392.1 FadR family transcriptional regulator [Mycolicibacterium sp. CBMA 331]MUM02930.1 FadR family transcriptional regulator [Mycolicibacterium sp. CBMA 334]MUM25079.1 FadR family transcriptional regulator [Mycolicibacterium sp. CBMA 295]MUM40039.1 FadR family transcriptional regulator [Mycolicibacterium sp. CBMA 247]
MTSQVQRHPLATQTAQLLLTRIRQGEWPLGHRLPGETTLAAQLGVGRSTLREAIRELSGKGVLESRQGAGVFVMALDAAEDWDTVLRRATIVSVIEARIAIESEAAALAAIRRTPADLRAIRRTLAARGVPGQSVPDHVDADMAFHRAVVAASHNDVLTQLFDAFLPRLRLAMIDMLRIRPIASEPCDHALHQQLADAITARDPEAAAESSRTHLSTLKESFA